MNADLSPISFESSDLRESHGNVWSSVEAVEYLTTSLNESIELALSNYYNWDDDGYDSILRRVRNYRKEIRMYVNELALSVPSIYSRITGLPDKKPVRGPMSDAVKYRRRRRIQKLKERTAHRPAIFN